MNFKMWSHRGSKVSIAIFSKKWWGTNWEKKVGVHSIHFYAKKSHICSSIKTDDEKMHVLHLNDQVFVVPILVYTSDFFVQWKILYYQWLITQSQLYIAWVTFTVWCFCFALNVHTVEQSESDCCLL